MTRPNTANLPASIRQRLLNLAKASQEDFSLVLSRYGTERLLYRLACSPFARQFTLKGAMLFTLWTGRMHRPTRDMDLLGHGDSSTEHIMDVFRQIAQTEVVPDGLVFDHANIRVEDIRGNQEYGGKRVELLARLEAARIPIQVDIGFGDSIIPAAQEAEYPSLLDLPAPRILTYSRETAVAEKLQAMVVLGMLNSRMKDYYDVDVLAAKFPFDGAVLGKAVVGTFQRRGTAFPENAPVGLTVKFGIDRDKETQWQAFLRRSRLEGPALSAVVERLGAFLLPILSASARNGEFDRFWEPGGPWQQATTRA